MKDILGILIPMLLSGSDIGDIISALGGAGNGASGFDGLSAMMNAQMNNAVKSVGLSPNQSTIDKAAEMLVDRLGVNPLSGLGQGMSSMFGSLYHLAPDTFGSILGVPNGGRFFSQIAGGASGIGEAAGFGPSEMFNPYSVMATHRRAMKMGRTVYELGTREGGGYNIGFSHGLNMEEMGMMSQRLLSSEIPYMEYKRGDPFGGIDVSSPTGRKLNPENENDAEDFRNNLEQLGSRFNEAASMLSKITGSVKDAIGLMDRLAGGNFLGGTAEQATEVANRAKKMAAAIRITSAMAGMSPQEAYANMTKLQSGIVEGMGVNSYVGEASGFSSLMTGMAFNGTMAYNMWAAANPNASEQEKAQALLAANGRTQAYATSNGASLAALFADNEHLFTEEERSRFEQSFRDGDPNRMVAMIRERVGSEMFSEYMTDPAMQAAARVRAGRKVERYDQAGMEGNLAQAEAFGAKRLLGKALTDIDDELESSGEGNFQKAREDAVREKLVGIAMKHGASEKELKNTSTEDIRNYILAQPGMDAAKLQRIENTAEIEAAKKQIDSATMTEDEEKSAREKVAASVSAMEESPRKAKLEKMLTSGVALETVVDEFTSLGMTEEEKSNFREGIFGRKITRSQADIKKKRLDRIEDSQRPEFSIKERMTSLERDVKRSRIESTGELEGLISGKDFDNQSDNAAMYEFARRAKELEGQDIVFTGDDENLSGTYREAAKRMVAKIFDGNVGDLSEEEQKSLEESVAKNMLQGLYEFGSFDASFVNALDSLTDDQKKRLEKGGGLERIQQLKEQAQDKNSRLRKTDLNKTAFFSATKSLIGETTEAFRTNQVKEMRDIAEGRFDGTDAQASERFYELARSVGLGKGADGKDISLDDLRRSGMEDILKDAGVSSDEVSELSKRAMEIFGSKQGGGDAGKSMAMALRERAKSDGVDADTRKRLEMAASGIEKRDDISSSFLNGVLGRMYGSGVRDQTFNAMYAAGTKDQALVNKAASQSGVDMRKTNFGENAAAAVSSQDDIDAEASQNRFSNAIQAGGTTFTRDAIAHTRKQIEELGRRLSKAGIGEDVLSDLASGDKEKSEAAAKTIKEKALKGRTDSGYDLALIQSVSESTIGGLEGKKVLLEGAKGLEKARKAGGADKLEEDLVGITKSAGRKDSDAHGILSAISDLVKKFSEISTSNPIPVKIAGGNITVKSTWPF